MVMKYNFAILNGSLDNYYDKLHWVYYIVDFFTLVQYLREHACPTRVGNSKERMAPAVWLWCTEKRAFLFSLLFYLLLLIHHIDWIENKGCRTNAGTPLMLTWAVVTGPLHLPFYRFTVGHLYRFSNIK